MRSFVSESNLIIDVVTGDDEVTFVLAGELDLASGGRVRSMLGLVDPGAHTVALDMAEVSFVDSSGLVAIVQAHLRLQHEGRVLELRRVPNGVQQVLVLTELIDYLRVV